MLYIRDKYLKKIEPYMGKEIIKVLVGQRRVGKSKLLQMIKDKIVQDGGDQDQILFLNMEDLGNEKYRDYQQFYKYAQKFKRILVDEVQNIERWEEAILSLWTKWKDVYLTWSNSQLLSSEIATKLRWRYIQFEIFPFDRREFIDAFESQPTKDVFLKYIRWGGLPYLLHLPKEDEIIFEYLQWVFSATLLKDVVERYKVRNTYLLEKLVIYLASNVGNIFSARKIASFLASQRIKISTATVVQYLWFLQNVFLIKQIKRRDISSKSIFEVKEKYFFNDVGIRNAIVGGFFGKDISGILENIVAINLLSNGRKVFVGELDGKEVDFVAQKEWKKIYVQVAYLLPDTKTGEREFGNLLKIKDSWPKYVVSMDDVASWSVEGVRWLPVWEFLMKV